MKPQTKLKGKSQTSPKRFRNIPSFLYMVYWCHLTKTPQSVTLKNLEAKKEE